VAEEPKEAGGLLGAVKQAAGAVAGAVKAAARKVTGTAEKPDAAAPSS
jgi:hypothetical protein